MELAYILVLCELMSGPRMVTGAQKMLMDFFSLEWRNEYIFFFFSPHCLWNLFSFISHTRERKTFFCGEGTTMWFTNFRNFHINGQLLCSSLTIHWHYIYIVFFKNLLWTFISLQFMAVIGSTLESNSSISKMKWMPKALNIKQMEGVGLAFRSSSRSLLFFTTMLELKIKIIA